MTGPSADRETQRLLDRDESRHVVLVVVDGNGVAIRGVGEFIVEEATAAAELAVVVEDAFQGRGIGQLLFRQVGIQLGFGVVRFSLQL